MSPSHTRHPRRTRAARLGVALATLLAAAPAALTAQATPRPMDGLRAGVTLGGTGTVGITVEWVGESHGSVEASLATWRFRDVSLGVTARRYFGGAYLRPVVGGGLWLSHALAPDERGTALLLRVPVGVDWRAGGEHFLGVTLGVNRALWRARTNVEREDIPPDDRLVPVPELAWRWRP